MSCFFSTFLATSQIEMSEIQRSCSASAIVIADFARVDSRRSCVSHQTQACVSRSVSIPPFTRAKRIPDLLQDASSKPAFFGGLDVGNELCHGTAALCDNDGRFGGRDLIERLQTHVLELSGGDRLHGSI